MAQFYGAKTRGMRDCGGNCGIVVSIGISGITARNLVKSHFWLVSYLNLIDCARNMARSQNADTKLQSIMDRLI